MTAVRVSIYFFFHLPRNYRTAEIQSFSAVIRSPVNVNMAGENTDFEEPIHQGGDPSGSGERVVAILCFARSSAKRSSYIMKARRWDCSFHCFYTEFITSPHYIRISLNIRGFSPRREFPHPQTERGAMNCPRMEYQLEELKKARKIRR